MKTTTLNLATLNEYPGNPRVGDVAALAESLRINGQYRPIVVQESTNTILAGNHLAKAAREIGWTEIGAVLVDVDEAQARRIVAADNRTSDLGTYDDGDLAALLSSLGDLDGTGYDTDDLDDLLAGLQEVEPLGVEDPDVSSGVRHTNTFEEDGSGYADRAQRLLILTLPPEHFVWLVESLEKVGATFDGDLSNTEIVMRLVADHLGTTAPAIPE